MHKNEIVLKNGRIVSIPYTKWYDWWWRAGVGTKKAGELANRAWDYYCPKGPGSKRMQTAEFVRKHKRASSGGSINFRMSSTSRF